MNRKFSMIVACSIVAAFAAGTMAQESILWWDSRNNTGAPGTVQNILSPTAPFTNGMEFAGPPGVPPVVELNGGMRGDGQKIWIEPQITPLAAPNNYTHTVSPGAYPNFDADGNHATGDAYLYLDMLGPFGTDDVMSSIGLDLVTSQTGTPANSHRLQSLAFTLEPITPAWTGASAGSLVAGDPPAWENIRMVNVPVAGSPPAYDENLGLQPGGPYKLGKLRATAALRNCLFSAGHNSRSRISLHMNVDSLLVTRVFRSGGDAEEMVSLGYPNTVVHNGTPDAAVSGNSTADQTATQADLVIEIRLKGDFSGDGRTDGSDLGGFNVARTDSSIGNMRQAQAFLGDLNGSGAVDGSDLGLFNAIRNRSAQVTCP